MKALDSIAEQIVREMDEKDAVRELALKSSRAVIRLAGSAIRGTHRKENVDGLMHEMKDELAKMLSVLKGHPDLYYSGFVENAFIEYSEASIVMAVVRKKPLPAPKELGVSSGAYLLGMGDAVGEFRRFALNSLREGNIKSAYGYLAVMEEIHNMLMRFDYPDALLSVRRQQDLSRSLVEKTSGEITLSARTHELEKRLNELQKHLKKDNDSRRKRARK
jgi:translin